MITLRDTDVKKRACPSQAIQAAVAMPVQTGWEGQEVDAGLMAETRDPLLEAQIQAQASLTGALAAQHTNLQFAGTCLDELIHFGSEPNGLNGLDADLTALLDGFEALSSDPANLPLRRKVARHAQDVASKFNRAALRLDCLKNDLNASIQRDAAQANHELNEIAGLNQQIMEARSSGIRDCALASQREQSLERLSGRIDIVVTRRADGAVNVAIGGVVMISGATVADRLAAIPDKNETLRIQTQNAGTRLEPEGGSIAGKLTARDGGLAALQRGLNSLASQLISRFNSICSSGSRWNGVRREFFAGTDASNISVNNTFFGEALKVPVQAHARN